MATRRVGGLKWAVASLAMAGVATAVWAAGGGVQGDPETVAASQQQDQPAQDQPAQDQSAQDQQAQDQGPGADQRGFRRGDGAGGSDRGFDGRRFDRGGFDRGGGDRGEGGPGPWRHHWHRHWHRGHGGWGRPGWGPGRGFAGRGPGGRFGPGLRRGPAMGAMMLDAPMLRAFRQLNLSDAQRQRLRTILMSARDSARQRREGRSGAAAARQSLAAIVNPGDPNYARAVQAAKDLAVQRIQQATQTQQALYAVLTPAQKTQLSQIFAQRRARRQQFEQRAAGRRSGSAPRGGAPDGAQPGGTP